MRWLLLMLIIIFVIWSVRWLISKKKFTNSQVQFFIPKKKLKIFEKLSIVSVVIVSTYDKCKKTFRISFAKLSGNRL